MGRTTPHAARLVVGIGATLAAVLVVGACSKGSSSNGSRNTPAGSSTSTQSTTSAPPAVPDARVSVAPASGAAGVNPTAPITVNVAQGTLTSVTMSNDGGKPVSGKLSPDKTSWRATEVLGYAKSYRITAKAMNSAGKSVTKTSSFRTLTPNNMTLPYINTTGGYSLQNGATYGVGLVVAVHWDEAISNRAAAEKTLHVTTSPKVSGSWYWEDNQNVHWRPSSYYTPGTKVTVTANVYGVDVGNGLYGQQDVSTSFKIGARHVSVADDKTHQVYVYFGNKLVNTMPTSMGRGGLVKGTHGMVSLWTMNGTYTVIGHEDPAIMSSASFGLPANSPYGYAPEKVYKATRISTDGIYLHSAPWSVWAQGNTDTSHGCLNLSPANAAWYYATSQIGDVVEVKNTGGPLIEVWQNGDWSVPWSEWLKGSALH